MTVATAPTSLVHAEPPKRGDRLFLTMLDRHVSHVLDGPPFPAARVTS